MPSLAKYQARTADRLNPELSGDIDYLVPTLVNDWGMLAGTPARAKVGKWEAATTMDRLSDNYSELVFTTAHLLALFSVEAVGGDAITSVTNKLSAMVDPLVSIGTRVDRLYRSYRMGELDRVRHEAELLWVALEYRCDRITGQTFAKVIG